MSKAFKCDRCGKLFEPHIGDGNLDISITDKVDDSGDRTLGGWEWEVCSGCLEEVLKVVNAKP